MITCTECKSEGMAAPMLHDEVWAKLAVSLRGGKKPRRSYPQVSNAPISIVSVPNLRC
jgi:hypothetical protein